LVVVFDFGVAVAVDVAFDLAVDVESVVAAEEPPVERSGTGGLSAARKNLSMMIAPPPCAVR
jgi:hypothetical protein